MLALVEYEAGICECGFHESVADLDPDLELDPRICPVCKGIAQMSRVMDAQDDEVDKALGENPSPDAPRASDGRHLRLIPARPADQPEGAS